MAGTTPGHGGFTDAPDATPRSQTAVIGLPMMAGNNGTIRGGQQPQQQQAGTTNYGHQRQATIRPHWRSLLGCETDDDFTHGASFEELYP